ncbi:MAG: hypothetical protein M3Y57_20075 [Acidobacteriota bacterium]|nr:hypothetical protein [Acidobacteriota bacterium]
MADKLPPPFVIGETYVDRESEYVVTAVDGEDIEFVRPDGTNGRNNARIKATIHRNMITEIRAPRAPGNRAGIYGWHRPTKGGILEEMYSFIAEIIERQSEVTTDYIPHDDIAGALIKQEYGGPLLRQRSEDDARDAAWFASDYVAFYSKEWTEGRPRHAEQFERKKIRGKWAYRVRR